MTSLVPYHFPIAIFNNKQKMALELSFGKSTMKWLEPWLTFAGRSEEGDPFPSQLVYSGFRSTEEIQ